MPTIGDIDSTISIGFKVDVFGVYFISITAICEQENDLKVMVDDTEFREIPAEKNVQTYDVPPAWNGSKLKGLAETITFLLVLNQGEHTLTFVTKNKAKVEFWDYKLIDDVQNIQFSVNKQATDGDRRPWHTFALINLPLKVFSADITTHWHWRDGDDVKLIVDGKVKENSTGIRQKDWLWSSTFLKNLLQKQREIKSFEENLPQDIHYIEFWADRTPTLHNVTFNLGNFTPKRIPTKNDPKWTGSFDDDTDHMILARLIFGEARNQPKGAMTGVGWVIKNRLLAKRKYFGSNYHEIIQKNDGRYYQFSCFIPNDPNFELLIDPLNTQSEVTKQKWLTAYDIAGQVIDEKVKDPTKGATYFHSEDLSQKHFVTKSVPGAIYLVTIGAFLFYQDPNEKKK